MPSFHLPPVIGHRGAAAHAPENTLAGFRKAKELGVGWVEFDVRLTQDGHPVLSHDAIPSRTMGYGGVVEKTPLPTLLGLDAGSWFGPAFAREPVPTLTQALSLLATLDIAANIEIKPQPRGKAARAVEAVGAVVAAAWPRSAPPPLLSSFDSRVVAEALRRLPHLPRALNLRGMLGPWRGRATDLGCVSVHLPVAQIGPRRAERVKKEGFGLAVFTVNDPAKARALWSWGVDGIFSDRPDALLAAQPAP
jgi:glycerophosphoryl diester phosphodiesterase